ncbi:chemical-damaging agent resistance protein C [Bacillus sp. M6-12]|uniref:TerD family protein n=1 Tax=Bacillus sp. M6-12 TaxID=2054166 RepID=UPI000C78B3B3|nr:TerD family protein [Bacillus sp. M6-12]PLS19466.1 chemical-damaging agent resistance protein C [Bacillus sp. M6-12]
MLGFERPQETLLMKKDERLQLTKKFKNLDDIHVGLGWDVNTSGRQTFDLDVIAFMLQGNGKVSRPKHTVYWGNPQSPEGAVSISPDNLDGEGEGDDEYLKIKLSQIPQEVEEVAIAVYIYDGYAKRQNFGLVNNSFIRIEDERNGKELVRYNLQDEYFTDTAIVCAKFIRTQDGWDFQTIGQGYKEELEGLCRMYGAV